MARSCYCPAGVGFVRYHQPDGAGIWWEGSLMGVFCVVGCTEYAGYELMDEARNSFDLH